MNKCKKIIIFLALFLCLVILAPTYIYASSNGDNNKNTKNENSEEIDDSATSASYDYTKDEPFTQGFYREKAAFQSDDDYKDYCKNMYNYGYMNKAGNWTPSAKNFINNQTSENMKALDDNAKEVVEQRIEKGEMSFEDSPYLTSEEKQKMEKEEAKEATQQSDGTGTKDNDSLLDNEDADSSDDSESDTISSDYEDESDMDADEEDDSVEEPAQQKKGSLFGKIIMAILICGIAIVSYSIYRRQF